MSANIPINFFAQFFMLILNLAIFSITIWIRFDLDFARWVWMMEWYTYWYCTYVCMVAAIFGVAACILGLYATAYVSECCSLLEKSNLTFPYLFQDRTGLMQLVLGCTVIIGLLQFIGTVVILVYGVEESKTLTDELNEVFLRLIYNWDVEPKAAYVMRQIMEYVSIRIYSKNIFPQSAGFEPARAEPIGFRVQRLNHSATTAQLAIEMVATRVLNV